MTQDAATLAMVDRIYHGATEPGAWMGIVEDLARHFRAPRAWLFTPLVGAADGGFVLSDGIDQKVVQVWADHYVPHDIWVQAGIAKGLLKEGMAVIDTDLVPRRQLRDSVIYREYLRVHDIVRLCSGVIFDQQASGVMSTLFSAFRGTRDRPFTSVERHQMRRLLPHLSRALGVMYKLRDAEFRTAVTLAALDKIPSAVILLGPIGEVRHINQGAETILRRGDGISVKRTHAGPGRIALRDDRLQSELDRLIADAAAPERMGDTAHFSRALRVRRTHGNAEYLIQISAISMANPFTRDAGPVQIVAFITEPRAAGDAVNQATLTRAFDLTPAEARLAMELLQGDGLVSAARRMGVSLNTAKTQQKAIFGKTGVRSQAQLVRLVLSITPPDIHIKSGARVR